MTVYDLPECASTDQGAMPLMRGESSLNQKPTLTERQSLSAHQAAEPQRDRKFVLLLAPHCPLPTAHCSLVGIPLDQTLGCNNT